MIMHARVRLGSHRMLENSLILGLNDSTQIKAQTTKAKSDKILVQNIDLLTVVVLASWRSRFCSLI